jgi:hypothetical protein
VKASEGFERSLRFVHGWDQARDATTGLYAEAFPSPLLPPGWVPNPPVWTPRNSGADLWPFMVIATYYTDKKLFESMRTTLKSEIALASRVGPLPDDYDLTKSAFVYQPVNLGNVVFGSAEYVKDGLTPIMELIFDKDYFDRMLPITTALCKNGTLQSKEGPLPWNDIEINGDVLLTLTRLYMATGDAAYLDCSKRIADYYLFENPVIASTNYRLRDHGGEVTSGLVEAYYAMKLSGMPAADLDLRKVALKRLLDRILEVGRNADGMFYNAVDLVGGSPTDGGVADTWGYVYDGFYAYHMIEGETAYRDAVRSTLKNLGTNKTYRKYGWEGSWTDANGDAIGSQDGYADTLESAINLVNREPVPEALDWIETEIQVFFKKQRDDGVIEAWWGDGNFARTAMMYALMHTQGAYVDGWRKDVRIGAVRDAAGTLYVHLEADQPWTGKLCFDEPRHLTHLKLPIDYPRLNQFPEWFTVDAAASYAVTSPTTGSKETLAGKDLLACLPITLAAGAAQNIEVKPLLRDSQMRLSSSIGSLCLVTVVACGNGNSGAGSAGGFAGAGGAAGLSDDALFASAAASGLKANEGFERALRVVHGWEQARDAKTGLYAEAFPSPLLPPGWVPAPPRWTPSNSAADLWPFLVIATFFTDKPAFEGMRQTLKSETTLTSRVGPLVDDYDLTKGLFVSDPVDMGNVVFGSAEYIKDGLTPVMELLFDGDYFARMQPIAAALCKNGTFPSKEGPLPSDNIEINGDVMLTLTRLYTATGDAAYLDCSRRISHYYLFENPVIASTNYRLRDHGGEITAGLVESYYAMKLAGMPVDAEKAALEALLDRVLSVGRNADGMFYNAVDLTTGKPTDGGLADTWGYVYDGFYTYYLIENKTAYRDAVRATLKNLGANPGYRRYPWEGSWKDANGDALGSQDGYADTLESALNLVNREPVPEAFDWIETEIQVFFKKQRDDGVIEAWWGDGNFARTALMYALMHTQGTWVEGWRKDVRFGAVRDATGTLFVHVEADAPWSGKLCFDEPRHATHLKLPIDYPRLNQFPEWFTADAGASYEVSSPSGGSKETVTGKDLLGCRAVDLAAGALAQNVKVKAL